MTLRAPFVMSAEFDPFLYASIGANGSVMPTSVISALAQLNIDPWQEAARLSGLPREGAAAALVDLIGRLPGTPRQRSETQETAARLIDLLPRRAAAAKHAPSKPGPRARPIGIYVILWLAVFALLAAAIFNLADAPDVTWTVERPLPIEFGANPPE